MEALIAELISGEVGLGTIIGAALGEVIPIVVFAICPIVLWFGFRRFALRVDNSFRSVATGFGVMALSVYLPIVVESTLLGFASDESLVPEWPFNVASAVLLLVGTVAVWRGLKAAAAARTADGESSRNGSPSEP